LEEDIETWPRGVRLDLIYHVVKFAAQRFSANFGDPIVVKVRFEIVQVKQRSWNVFQLLGSLVVSKKSAENFQLLWLIWIYWQDIGLRLPKTLEKGALVFVFPPRPLA
jgi:hypothetical protein